MHFTKSTCSGCDKIFAGMRAFDAHRTGSHDARTRHCLTTKEMTAMGMTQDDKGWWTLPLRVPVIAGMLTQEEDAVEEASA